MKLPVVFDPAIVEELAERLVGHSLHAYREAVANAYDADSPKILIENSAKSISFEDWGEGVEDVTAFTTIGRPSKAKILETPKYNRKPIGSKGLGFLSYFKLGRQVMLSTNNGIVGYRIIRTPNAPLEADTTTASANSFLDHKGLKVEITKLKRMIDDEELTKYLKMYFSLIMCRGFSITINGKELIPKRLSPTVSIETKFGKIVGDFHHHGGGVADIYCRGLFVCKTGIEAGRNFQAWVDCDFLVPQAGREDFVKDNLAWNLFLDAMKTYALKFPRSGETITPRFEQTMKKILKALGNVATELGMRVEGKIPVSPSQHLPNETPTIEGETGQEHEEKGESRPHKPIEKRVPDYDKMHNYLPTGKMGKILKTDYGINLVYGQRDDQLSPIVPETPNTLIYNHSSEILKTITIEEKRTHGASTAYLLIPYLARAYVHLLPTQTTENPDELADSLTNRLYKKLIHIQKPSVPSDTKRESWN